MMINTALIAHDGKKSDMVSFVLNNKDILANMNLYATGTTGKKIEGEGFKVEKLLSGPMGGDAQIAAMIATGQIDMVIFLGILLISILTNLMYKCWLDCVMYTMYPWRPIQKLPFTC